MGSPTRFRRHLLRRQLPAHSPLSLRALLAGSVAALGGGGDPGGRLAALLSDEYGARGVMLLGSGTQALQVALRLALDRAGASGGAARLALPAYCCFDVASAAVWTGAEVLFYDVDPETLAPDLETLEAALRGGAAVAVVAPLYGLPIPWSDVRRLASEYGALLVEDAAQGFGARWQGRPLGSLGDLGVLSFGRGKGWTSGKGGAVLLSRAFAPGGAGVASRAGLVQEAKVLAGSASQWVLARPAVYGLPARLPWLGLGETRYHAPADPRALSRAAAATALAVRAASQKEVLTRARNAREILARFPRSPALRPVGSHADAGAAFLRLPLLGERGMSGFPSPAVARELGVMPGYPLPLSRLPALATRVRASARFPGAELLCQRLVTMPTHSMLNSRDVAALLEEAAAYR